MVRVVHLCHVVHVVRVVRVVSLDDMLSEIIWFYALNNQILEKS